MALGIKCCETIKVQVEGENEEAAAAALQAIVESTEH
jgi:phosphotransferase system HPr-like phosphotransfer protein